MGKHTTISVPVQVKKNLELMKGNKTWGEFLLEALTEWKRLRGEKAFQEPRKLLTEDDLKAIRESSRKFRENFNLRDF